MKIVLGASRAISNIKHLHHRCGRFRSEQKRHGRMPHQSQSVKNMTQGIRETPSLAAFENVDIGCLEHIFLGKGVWTEWLPKVPFTWSVWTDSPDQCSLMRMEKGRRQIRNKGRQDSCYGLLNSFIHQHLPSECLPCAKAHGLQRWAMWLALSKHL